MLDLLGSSTPGYELVSQTLSMKRWGNVLKPSDLCQIVLIQGLGWDNRHRPRRTVRGEKAESTASAGVLNE